MQHTEEMFVICSVLWAQAGSHQWEWRDQKNGSGIFHIYWIPANNKRSCDMWRVLIIKNWIKKKSSGYTSLIEKNSLKDKIS